MVTERTRQLEKENFELRAELNKVKVENAVYREWFTKLYNVISELKPPAPLNENIPDYDGNTVGAIIPKTL